MSEPSLSNVRTFELLAPQPKPVVTFVDILVKSAADQSNPVQFFYGSSPGFCVKPSWQTTKIKLGAFTFNIANITAVKYGFDGVLYTRIPFNLILAFTLNHQLSVAKI